MKKRFFTFLAIAGIALAGCSHKIDTAKVRAATQSLEPSMKAQVDEACTDIEAGKFKEAYPLLRKVVWGVKLTPEQNDVLKDTLTKVQAKMNKE